MPHQKTVFDTASKASHDYRQSLSARPVMPDAASLARLKTLHGPLPIEGEDEIAVIDRLHDIGSPNTVATTGGRFFGFVVGGALPVSVAASWLASTWDQNAGSWLLSPIAGELEVIAGGWLLELLDLPRDAAFGFVTGATMATYSSLAAARSSLLNRQGYDVKKSGLTNAPRLRVVMSEEIHPTNIAALGYAGIGTDQIEYCPVDDQGRIIPSAMPRLDPLTIVMLQAGNINSGAFDDFETVCEMARAVGAWVHVDGAFGLWARTSQDKAHLTSGIDLADSWSVDGHKWPNLTQDSAVYFCRDSEAVHDVFGVDATYLMKDANRQPNNFTPELSRRARGIEFWAVLKTLGANGVASIVDRSCAHAQHFAEGLRQAGYKILNDVVLNQIVFVADDEAQTRRALKYIQDSGQLWLGPTHWKGHYAMRISVSSAATTEDDVTACLKIMTNAYHESQK
ncbi:pyridoxal phosphate-dependent decarboxylase family protein [Algimonas porphyrae]|uniref:Aspartate aminotransferase family protein n=1 Tax=Algimonas porphyrae TaxID=1128113 RepID=A0ABQ5V4M1_9PROT|nr:pyridoxal-dependent decarboxylase [Algimonas porphyrae]GLQ21909.1 aspartate aminotransferase family protein [Algimonas porphyrae]